MTPKEKAKELVEWAIKYGASKEVAKLFSIRTVDECLHTCIESMIYYWEEVKQEIEKL
jgi:hypothetical protein